MSNKGVAPNAVFLHQPTIPKPTPRTGQWGGVETLGETTISKFDLLFRGKVTPMPTVFEVIDDEENVSDDDEKL